MADEPRSGNWWQTLPGLITAFATLITAIGGLLVILQKFAPNGAAKQEQVVVQRVIDLTPDAARATLEPTGLIVGPTQPTPVPMPYVGKVRRQDPVEGTRVAKGTTVILFVGVAQSASASSGMVTVPRLVDLSIRDARDLLEQRRLQLGSVSPTPAAPRYVGKITSQDPAEGRRVRRDTRVDVEVGRGQPPSSDGASSPSSSQLVPMPRFIDMSELDARALLTERRFRLGGIEYIAAVPRLVGKVTGQDPPPGRQVPPGSLVKLYVGKAAQ